MKKTTKIIVALIMGVVGSMMISCANPNGSDDYIPSIPSIPSNYNDDTDDNSIRKYTVKFHADNVYDTSFEVNDGEKIPSDKIPSGYDWNFGFETPITENVIIEGTVKSPTPSGNDDIITPSGNDNDDDVHVTPSKELINYDLNVNNNKVYIVLSSNETKITSTTNASKFNELCGLIKEKVTIKNNGQTKQFSFNVYKFSLGPYVELNKGENVLTDMIKSFETNDYKFEFKTNAYSIYNRINGTTIYR